MKLKIFIFILFLFANQNLIGQIKIVIGRVIDENLESIPEAIIQSSDTILIGKTNVDGYFRIEVPSEIDILFFRFIAMEWKTIKLSPNCDNADIILMYDAIYDFMTAEKIDKLRMKRFKKLPELHRIAYEKGLFTTPKPCYEQSFDPIYGRLKENEGLRKN